jgi:hypothetical protein
MTSFIIRGFLRSITLMLEGELIDYTLYWPDIGWQNEVGLDCTGVVNFFDASRLHLSLKRTLLGLEPRLLPIQDKLFRFSY